MQRTSHTFAMQLCGIAQNRHLSLGSELIAQGYRIVDYRLELGVYGRLTIAGKGYHIGHSPILAHLLEHHAQRLAHILARVESRLRGAIVVVPSAFAIDAIEVA
jgi:hypothetical protein